MKLGRAFAAEEYCRIASYAEHRRIELEGMLAPYVKVTDSYGELAVWLTLASGRRPPDGVQDEVMRDLLADVFDALLTSRALLLENMMSVSFPVARRAFESLCLFVAFSNDSKLAAEWQDGQLIRNARVRKAVASHPLSDPVKHYSELYDYFSEGSHPNRTLVPMRFLGDPNEFVLGAIGLPSLLMIVHHSLRHLNLWFWFVAAASWSYRFVDGIGEPAYSRHYSSVAAEAKKVSTWLAEEHNRLLDEERQNGKT